MVDYNPSVRPSPFGTSLARVMTMAKSSAAGSTLRTSPSEEGKKLWLKACLAGLARLRNENRLWEILGGSAQMTTGCSD